MAINLSDLNLDQAGPNDSPEYMALEQVHLGINEVREALHEAVGDLGESLYDPQRAKATHSVLRCIEYRLAAVHDEAEAGVHAGMKEPSEAR